MMRAVHLKSFDYRVLNLLLYQLRGEEVNELHMEFISMSEFLIELSDDIIYGASRAPTMLVIGGSLEESNEALAMAEIDARLFSTVDAHPTRCKVNVDTLLDAVLKLLNV
ncbi:uncharacterized protein [Coffea arabica]|uniref:Uncharacterized protein isoform X2 n=1 Tax=Coffea arabica TaxID=13443 RepID=A0ABM4WYC9_COFAR